MPAPLDLYLAELRKALGTCDRAVVQDALYDTRKRVERETVRLSWADPLLDRDSALARALEALGPPEEVAQAFLQRERVVDEALDDTPDEAPGRPWPSFLGIFTDPKAYTSLLYMLLALPLGIFSFVWVVTGLSVSLGLLVVVVGFPLLVLFLGSVRALGLAQGRLVETLLDVRMPRRPPLMPEGVGLTERLGGLFRDGYTWASLLYLLLNFPLGIVYFVLSLVSLVLSLGFLLAPLAYAAGRLMVRAGHLVWDPSSSHVHPLLGALVLGLLGFLGLVCSLHAGLALGRFQGLLARALLVRRG